MSLKIPVGRPCCWLMFLLGWPGRNWLGLNWASIYREFSVTCDLPTACSLISHLQKIVFKSFIKIIHLQTNYTENDFKFFIWKQITQIMLSNLQRRLYADCTNCTDDVDTCDKARVILFCNGHSQEALPPTSDVVKLHIKRAHYQAFIWKQANISTPILPQASETGWTLVDGHLYAVLA